ncbi:MAG: ribosome maturation factor RimM [Aquincola sp.]|nr:ribosome maturation factor RimM [Aquincola sp.]
MEFPADAIEVGRIAGAWGVKGWIKVQPFASDPQALFSSRRWFLRPPEGPGAAVSVPPLLCITDSRTHGSLIVAAAQEVADRAAADALRGARIFVSRASFPTASADEYYWVDLLGCDVVNRDGQPLGRVSGLTDTGAHSVLHVRANGAPERLIPFVAAYIDEVDLVARCIRVDWGLDF